MPINRAPRFTNSGDVASNAATAMAPTLTAAAADYTGISASNALVWTAGANGGRIVGLRFRAAGTNVASVARIYSNNGSVNTTAANNSLMDEIGLPAITATATNSTVPIDYIFPGGFLDLNASFRIYVGLGTAVAAGWVVTPIQGGKF